MLKSELQLFFGLYSIVQTFAGAQVLPLTCASSRLLPGRVSLGDGDVLSHVVG